jgi:ABC-type uncharacterized transport system substrate-binding protein
MTLREGLRALGFVEGQNFVFEFRSADGNADRLPDLAAELVRLRVDAVMAYTPCAVAAKRATTTIPIVMAAVADPIGAGLVQSLLARPGGNITGLSNMALTVSLIIRRLGNRLRREHLLRYCDQLPIFLEEALSRR